MGDVLRVTGFQRCEACDGAGHHDLAAVTAQRDHWIRLFNRLDAAVNHHRRDAEANAGTIGVETWDSALYAAQTRILRDAANIDRPKQPGGPRRKQSS
jgi:hypothetical protein